MRGDFENRLLVIERGLVLFQSEAFDINARARWLGQKIRESNMLLLGGAAGLITVTVKDSTTLATISGATVWATDGVVTIFTGTTDGSGVCKIPIYSVDPLTVYASHSGYVTGNQPITPVLNDTNTLTINLTPAFTCQGCTILFTTTFTLTLTYYTNAGHTTTNTMTCTLAYNSGSGHWDKGGTDSAITGIIDYYDPLAFGAGAQSHKFRLICSGGLLGLQHAWTWPTGSNQVTYPSSQLVLVCSPFSENLPNGSGQVADKTIAIS